MHFNVHFRHVSKRTLSRSRTEMRHVVYVVNRSYDSLLSYALKEINEKMRQEYKRNSKTELDWLYFVRNGVIPTIDVFTRAVDDVV